MKVEKLKEVIEIVSEANEEVEKLRHRDAPRSVAEIRIGAGTANIYFSSLDASAVASLVNAGFDVQIGESASDFSSGAYVYWRKEE